MSEVKVNKITPTTNCGTVTLGDSGDTVAIPCGVTLSNSGSITNSGTITNTGTISGGTITGTIDNQVNWDTTAKTAGFTAVAGTGYFVNTTSGAITVTLPATPSAGDLVGIKDYAGTAQTNAITIGRNGSNIQGTANDFLINTENASVTFIYVDGTQGWLTTASSLPGDLTSNPYIVATGGTITTCGDFKIHTFTGPGTFCVSQIGETGPNTVDYLTVAGGGGGNSTCGAGGGGAGGYRESHCSANSGCYSASPIATPTGITVTATAYPITVGGGGASKEYPAGGGNKGSNSVFSTITATGGGGGRGPSPSPNFDGGSGGGGSHYNTSGGAGNTPPVSPSQGNGGGTAGCTSVGYGEFGAGGGGAGASGGNGSGTPGSFTNSVGGNGGNGVTTSISASPTAYAGGGGGGTSGAPPGSVGGTGGTGGGGNGGRTGGPSQTCQAAATAGGTNTGGGGGAGSAGAACTAVRIGQAGGSGIVIIRYKYQ
jgi:hypothetical protein